MRARTFGRTGVSVSEIGFGAWAIGGSWGEQKEEDSTAALHRALDLGCTFIDTAAGYGNGRSERIIGKVLKERKETVFVATKTPPAPGPWPPSPYCRDDERYSESYLRANVEERLRNLGTERIDLLQLHTWTRAWNRNPRPFEVLRKLQAEGKIRFVGISTPEHDQNAVVDLMRGGWVDAVQVIYNVFDQEPAAERARRAVEKRRASVGPACADARQRETAEPKGWSSRSRTSRTSRRPRRHSAQPMKNWRCGLPSAPAIGRHPAKRSSSRSSTASGRSTARAWRSSVSSMSWRHCRFTLFCCSPITT